MTEHYRSPDPLIETRYVLDNDDDGHWYLIPDIPEVRDAFEAYYTDPSNNPYPEGVRDLGGHPNRVSFTDPRIN